MQKLEQVLDGKVTALKPWGAAFERCFKPHTVNANPVTLYRWLFFSALTQRRKGLDSLRLVFFFFPSAKSNAEQSGCGQLTSPPNPARGECWEGRGFSPSPGPNPISD